MKRNFTILILLLTSTIFTACGGKVSSQENVTSWSFQTTPANTFSTSDTQIQTSVPSQTPEIQTPGSTNSSHEVNLASSAEISASSSLELQTNWGVCFVNDGITISDEEEGSNGYTSTDSIEEQHEEWLEFDFGKECSVSKVVIYPRTCADEDENIKGFGYPVDLRIEVSTDETNWETVATDKNVEFPVYPVKEFTYNFEPVNATNVRIYAEKLSQLSVEGERYRFQAAEVEIY